MKLFSYRKGLAPGIQALPLVAAIIVICGLLDLANTTLQFLSGPQQHRPSLFYCLASIFLFWITYLVFVPGALFMIRKYNLDLRPWPKRLLIHTGAAIVFAYLHTTLSALLYNGAWQTHKPLSASLSPMVAGFPVDFFAYWAIIAIVFALDSYSHLQQRELAAAELQANLAEVRLQSIRAQLNPHFLFNTLNAISTLALKGEGKSVARALARLTGLLRTSLNDGRPEVIPLRVELEFIDNYLEMQRLLLGDRLVVERRILPDVLRANVPCMILQPLVENAIVHGISRLSGIGRIVIGARRADELLMLRVEDSGPGFRSEQVARVGIGLSNTEARLEHHYGPAHQIEYGRSPEGGACVTITLPLVCDAMPHNLTFAATAAP